MAFWKKKEEKRDLEEKPVLLDENLKPVVLKSSEKKKSSEDDSSILKIEQQLREIKKELPKKKKPRTIEELKTTGQLTENGKVFTKNNIPVTLSDVYDVYNKWFIFDSTDRIDLILAHRLTTQLTGKPVWIIVVGPSSDGKSDQGMSLHDGKNTMIVHEITDKTLVSGMKGIKNMAPEMDGKYVIFPDLSQLLKARSEVKAKVWAQLRELYDGRAGRRTGASEDPNYTGIRTTILMCATPSIDAQILIFNDLGTRELIWRTNELKKREIMEKVWNDEELEELKKTELKNITQRFINNRKITRKEISDEHKKRIEDLVIYLTYMRATAEIDRYTGQLINDATPESPARAIMILKRMFIALKNLDDDYKEEDALRIIEKLVMGSVNQQRRKILDVLIGNRLSEPYNITQISNKLRMGKKAVERQLNILWNLGIVDRTEIKEENKYGQEYIKEICWNLIPTHEVVMFVKQ